MIRNEVHNFLHNLHNFTKCIIFLNFRQKNRQGEAQSARFKGGGLDLNIVSFSAFCIIFRIFKKLQKKF